MLGQLQLMLELKFKLSLSVMLKLLKLDDSLDYVMIMLLTACLTGKVESGMLISVDIISLYGEIILYKHFS